AEETGCAAVDEDAVLRNPDRAGRPALDGDPLAYRAADRILLILRVGGAVDGPAGVPRLLAEVGLLYVAQRIRTDALGAAVAERLRPDPRQQVAEILDELPVLERADRPRAGGLIGDSHGQTLG